MNIDHLGDALDCWKGWVIGTLRNENLLGNLWVYPMFTDEHVAVVWNEASLSLYARLIGVADRSHIINPNVRFTTQTRRRRYFNAHDAGPCIDLFADPDTGIEPQGGADEKHIKLDELAKLLSCESTGIVLVYQHSFREDNWVDARLNQVANSDALDGHHAFALCAGSVSMVFISRSRDRGRLEACRNWFSTLMAPLPERLRRVTPIYPLSRVRP